MRLTERGNSEKLWCREVFFFCYETHVPAWRSFFIEKNVRNLKYSSERVSFCEEGVLWSVCTCVCSCPSTVWCLLVECYVTGILDLTDWNSEAQALINIKTSKCGFMWHFICDSVWTLELITDTLTFWLTWTPFMLKPRNFEMTAEDRGSALR